MARRRRYTSGSATKQTPGTVRLDSYYNNTTGLGTTRDKRTATTFRKKAFLKDDVLEALYLQNDFAATIIDAPIQDAMRAGYKLSKNVIHSEDQDKKQTQKLENDEASKIIKKMEALDFEIEIFQALAWSRTYGGAVLLIGAVDGKESTEPLDIATLKDIIFFRAIEKRYCTIAQKNTDMGSPNYGKPEMWRITNDGKEVLVHDSRLMKIDGISGISHKTRDSQGGYSISILERTRDALEKVDLTFDSITRLLDEATSVYLMKDIQKVLATNNADRVQSRLSEMHQTKAAGLAGLAMDASGEDYKIVSPNVSGYEGMVSRGWERLAAASSPMPVTRLFGMSPAGMNATGEHDLIQWYDRVAAFAKEKIIPTLKYVVNLVSIVVNGTKSLEDWTIKWNSLWQMSPQQEAEYRAKIAATDQVYIVNNVFTSEECRESHFGGDEFSAEIKINNVVDTVDTDMPEDEVYGNMTQDPKKKDPNSAFNGAQSIAMADMVERAAAGRLPRESVMAMLQIAFPITQQQAEAVVANAGTSSFVYNGPGSNVQAA